ncbi:hypothetical protein [Paenibacillus sp. MBLB4367]|uniref:hypothetical protein n=1 Tax=Paenibacillus sp. MBLB4367 TaxID=3384767 RepID=UPI00390813C3
MSYELTVHVKELNDGIIPQWLEEIRKFNMDADIHPDFSFERHSGFLPFRIVVYDCPNRALNRMELLSGYEIGIQTYKHPKPVESLWSKLFDKKAEESPLEKTLKQAKHEVLFSVSAGDSFEFRLAWFSAAALTIVCGGILTDPQEGERMDAAKAIRCAYQIVIDNEKEIGENDWRTHEFKEWLS